MALILEKKYVGEGGYRLFLGNRFLRLFPVYWIVLVATGIAGIAGWKLFHAGPLQEYFEGAHSLGVEAWCLVVIGNLGIVGQDLAYFLGLHPVDGSLQWTGDFLASQPPLFKFFLVPQAWSLSLEICFYFIAPLLAARSTRLLIVLVSASLAARLYIFLRLGLDHDPWLDRIFPLELALFFAGMLAYRLYKAGWAGRIAAVGGLILPVTLLTIFAFPFLQVIGLGPHAVNWLFYLWLVIALPSIFDRTKSSSLDARIGELSYPIYVVHLLVLYLMAPLIGRVGLLSFKGELAVILSIVAAWFLVRFVADPVERYRQYRVQRHRARYSTALVVP